MGGIYSKKIIYYLPEVQIYLSLLYFVSAHFKEMGTHTFLELLPHVKQENTYLIFREP